MKQAAVAKLLMPFVMLYVVRSLDTTDASVQRYIQVGFVVVHAAIFAVMAYIKVQILSTHDETIITVPVKMPDKKGQTEKKTVFEYDTAQFNELAFTKLLMSVAIMGIVFYKWETYVPLLFQCYMNPQNVISAPLFQIYVLKRPAKMDLGRPWETSDPMQKWLESFSAKPASESAEDKKRK